MKSATEAHRGGRFASPRMPSAGVTGVAALRFSAPPCAAACREQHDVKAEIARERKTGARCAEMASERKSQREISRAHRFATHAAVRGRLVDCAGKSSEPESAGRLQHVSGLRHGRGSRVECNLRAGQGHVPSRAAAFPALRFEEASARRTPLCARTGW